MLKYIISINRDKTKLVPFNWQKLVYSIDGVTLEVASIERMEIEVESDSVLQEIKKSVGKFCCIRKHL